jgi:hypothetical protein
MTARVTTHPSPNVGVAEPFGEAKSQFGLAKAARPL